MKEIIAHVSFTIVKDEEKRNTTPLLVLKTPTSIRASREVAIGGATAGAGVEPDDKGRNVSDDAGTSWGNWHRGADDGGGVWNGDGYWYIIMLGLGKSYGGDVFLRLSRGWLKVKGTSVGGSDDGNRGQQSPMSLN